MMTSAIAGFGLPGRGGNWEPVSAQRWPALSHALVRDRLTGLAVAAWEAGELALSEDQAAQLLEHHREAMLHALALEHTLLSVAAALNDAGIDFAVLKGPAIAHACYPDPGWRPFGDLDLLVRARRWRTACSVLARLGFRRNLPEPRPRFDERFGKGASHIGADGLQIDLHRTLALGPFGLWIDPEELLDRRMSFLLGGRLLPRLDDTGHVLHSCVHAVLGSWPPLALALRDVAQTAQSPNVEWEVLAGWARRWRLNAVIRRAFESVSSALNVELPEEARAFMAVKPGLLERRALGAYTTSSRQRQMPLLALLAIPGIGSKAAYLRALILPGRAFLAARTAPGSGPSYLRRWLVPIRWVAPRRS